MAGYSIRIHFNGGYNAAGIQQSNLTLVPMKERTKCFVSGNVQPNPVLIFGRTPEQRPYQGQASAPLPRNAVLDQARKA
jgi:hypothetical protein